MEKLSCNFLLERNRSSLTHYGMKQLYNNQEEVVGILKQAVLKGVHFSI